MELTTLKKVVAGLAIGGAALGCGTASAIVVGGVDFGSPGTNHIESTTLAETFITGNGQSLLGYGVVNTVNGSNSYAGGSQLYFVFHDYLSKNFSATSVDFTGGVIDVYLGPTFNLLNQSSLQNIATITGGGLYTPWATFSGHANTFASDLTSTLEATGALTGSTISFGGTGLLDVTGGLADVVAYLNSNTILDLGAGLADIAFTTSGNNFVLNSHDDTVGCPIAPRPGTPGSLPTEQGTGKFCIAGSADLRGDTVIPEPASLALVGLALSVAGVARRRKQWA